MHSFFSQTAVPYFAAQSGGCSLCATRLLNLMFIMNHLIFCQMDDHTLHLNLRLSHFMLCLEFLSL